MKPLLWSIHKSYCAHYPRTNSETLMISFHEHWKISRYVRIAYLAQTLTPQSISLYARILGTQTLITPLLKFHVMHEPTQGFWLLMSHTK